MKNKESQSTFSPFSASKVLIRSLSNFDLEAKFGENNFFSCKNVTGNASASSGMHNIGEENDRLMNCCEFNDGSS